MSEDTKKADDEAQPTQTLQELLEAHRAALKKRNDEAKDKLAAAGYDDEHQCVLTQMQRFLMSITENTMHSLQHLAHGHDDIDAGEAFLAIGKLSARYGSALIEASRASGLNFGTRDMEVAERNRLAAEEMKGVIAKIKAKQANFY